MILHQINDLYNGGEVQRYHNAAGIPAQSVGEHTWGCLMIYEQVFGAPPVHVAMALLYHDVAEAKTGDVPANAKWKSGMLRHSLDLLEEQELQKWGLTGYRDGLTEEENWRINYCDKMELMLYCMRLFRRGNRDALRPWEKVRRNLSRLLDQSYAGAATQEAFELFSDVCTQIGLMRAQPDAMGGYYSVHVENL